MTIELTDDSYILGFWYCHDPLTQNDWMLCMQRSRKTGKWHADYRFRYRQDDKIFGSEDKKSWYRINYKDDGSPPENDEELEHKMDGFQQHMRMMFPDASKLMIKGGLKDLLEKSKNVPWMHIRQWPEI